MSEQILVPGYRIERKLGHGGMAAVYLAIQESFGREVALKIMSPLLNSDPSFAVRFMREARIVAHIHHASIVPVYDVGEHLPYHYLSMEFLPGGDLRQRIAKRQEAVELFHTVCMALSAALDLAHRKGFVHRDIKPENVLFREDGTPVLTDFGIARALDSGTSLTMAGMLVGTPSYMSPEQVKGQELDGRSDLYSLGIVCYEILTGGPPFRADSTLSTALKHLSEPLPRLPSSLSRYQSFIDRLTAKDREERFASGSDVIRALRPLMNDTSPDFRASLWRRFGLGGGGGGSSSAASDSVVTPVPPAMPISSPPDLAPTQLAQPGAASMTSAAAAAGGAGSSSPPKEPAAAGTAAAKGPASSSAPGPSIGERADAFRARLPTLPKIDVSKMSLPTISPQRLPWIAAAAAVPIALIIGLAIREPSSEPAALTPVQTSVASAPAAAASGTAGSTTAPGLPPGAASSGADATRALDASAPPASAATAGAGAPAGALVADASPAAASAESALASSAGAGGTTAAVETPEERAALARAAAAKRAADAAARAKQREERRKLAEAKAAKEAEERAARQRAQQQEIERMLALGRSQFQAGALLEPAGANAAETYRAVLRMQPDQPAALAGLTRIGNLLADEAARATAVRDATAARKLIGQLQSVQPDNPKLAGLQAGLNQLEAGGTERSRRERQALERAQASISKAYQFLERRPMDFRNATAATAQYDAAAKALENAPGLPSLKERIVVAYASAVQNEIDTNDGASALKLIDTARRRDWMSPELEQLEAKLKGGSTSEALGAR